MVALAGCSSGGLQSDWERQNLKAPAAEEQLDPPAYPVAGRLLDAGYGVVVGKRKRRKAGALCFAHEFGRRERAIGRCGVTVEIDEQGIHAV